MTTHLEQLFNVASEPGLGVDVPEVAPPSAALAVPPPGLPNLLAEAEEVSIAVDVKKAAELNNYIQTGLAKMAEMGMKASQVMVDGIQAGDIDARTLEGTARLVEASVKALAEMNRLNLFLQERVADQRMRDEVEKMRREMESNRSAMSREKVLELVHQAKETSK